jgi:uncharacterized protein with PQ loop repeat
MNEIQNFSCICQTDKIVTTKVNKMIIFLFFIIAVIAMQLRTLRVLIGSFMITWYMNYIVSWHTYFQCNQKFALNVILFNYYYKLCLNFNIRDMGSVLVDNSDAEKVTVPYWSMYSILDQIQSNGYRDRKLFVINWSLDNNEKQ